MKNKVTGEDNETNAVTGAVEFGSLETVGDIIDDAVINIPSPIRKNAIKALGQLCTSVIDIPIARFEGIAAEERAESRARIKIIDTAADQITQQMDVDQEYARVAVKKWGNKIVKEQVNLDNIAKIAASELKQNCKAKSETEIPDISLDWLNAFEREARNKSSDEMRLLFGKILASEISNPTTYSIKTVRLLSQLDNRAASLFQTLCSLCSTLQMGTEVFDSRVISLGENAASNSLSGYGLSFSALNILQEYGLIISDYNSYIEYRSCIISQSNQAKLGFRHQGKLFVLKAMINGEKENPDSKMFGVQLSEAGKELLGIIDISPSEAYTKKLIEYFQSKGFEMLSCR